MGFIFPSLRLQQLQHRACVVNLMVIAIATATAVDIAIAIAIRLFVGPVVDFGGVSTGLEGEVHGSIVCRGQRGDRWRVPRIRHLDFNLEHSALRQIGKPVSLRRASKK